MSDPIIEGNIGSPNRSPKSLTLNVAAQGVGFASLGGGGSAFNVAASHNLASIVAAAVLPNASKVLRVAVTSKAVSGSPLIQIKVASTGKLTAPSGGFGAVGAANAYATLGTTIFTAPITLSCNNYLGQTIAPAQMNALYQSGTVFTAHVHTTTHDTATGITLNIETDPFDEHPNEPLLRAFGPSDF